MKEIDLITEWIAIDILEAVSLVLGHELYEKAGFSWIREEKEQKENNPYAKCAGC